MIGEAIANLPWQPRPATSNDLVWRFSGNPLTGYRPARGIHAVYNSAVVPYEGAFAGVFRADHADGMPTLHSGRSPDGLSWRFDEKPIELVGGDPEMGIREYAYDPRVTRIGDAYYVTWCNGNHGPTIGIAETRDFTSFRLHENAFLPYNRNGVLFPRKIGGRFAMLSRPSDAGHTPFGDIFYSESPDMTFWGRHRHVMAKGPGWWQDLKIGPGPTPIETTEGWLLIYHGVAGTCNGYVYRMGVALLDLEQPWKVLHRAAGHIFGPEMPYETTGYVPNVVFPCAALVDAPTGRVAIYYGAADTFVALAFAHLGELVAFAKQRTL